MIDHQYSMPCGDAPEAVNATGPATPLTIGSTILEPPTTIQNPKKWSATCTPKYLFESRGAVALKAALKERNKLKIRQLPPNEPVPPSLFEQKALRLAQRVKERKRVPRNTVLFSDPIVTKHYEYEPEYDGYVRTESSPTSTPAAVEQEVSESDKTQTTNTKVGSVQQEALEPQKKQVTKVKRVALTSSLEDDDDDEELYTLAPSDEMDLHADKILQSNKANNRQANKRLRDSAEDLEEERSIKSNSASGGLFSSPKVAKIAPYFEVDDRIEQKRTRAILHNRYKQTSANQRSRSISHTQSESQQSGYLGWLSTFLSNQLNKLIF